MQGVLACASSVAAITAITYLETKAMERGINGKLFAIVIATIAGLGGFFVRDIFAVIG